MAKPKVGQIAASKPRFEEVNGDGHVFQGVNFYDDTPVPVAEPTPAVRTWGEAATDMGAGVLKGALGVAQLGARVGDALTYRQGDENPAIRFLNEYGEAVDMQKSEKLRGEEQKAQQAIVAAGQSAKERYGDGLGGKVARFGAEFGTGAYEAVSNPTLLANSLAEQIPMMGTMKAGQKAAELLARGATKVAPGAMATSVGKRIAGNAGLGGAVATGMALQGSDIKGDTYRRMMELPLDMWRQNPEFVTLAKSIGEDAAKIEIAKRESSTAGWQSAGASLATSLLPGGTAMERALVGGKKIPLKAVPQSVAGEFTQESGEEGLGQLASNNAVAKINVKQDRMEGVGGAAGQGGAVGGILGGGTTLARVGLQNYADKPTTPAVDPAIAAAAAKAAQQEAARKAAVSAVHTAAATPNSPIARAAAAANPLTPEEAWAKAQELDAQAALDEANGVAPVDPDTAPAAVPSGDPIEDAQKLIDASLAQAERDKEAQRAAMGQPADPMQRAGETQAPTVKDSLQVQAEPAAQPVTAPTPQKPEQFPPSQSGDILNLQGKPFNTMAGAMLKLKRLGGGHEIVRVDGGLAIRPKAAESVAVPANSATESAAPGEIERYQWQRNAEGGQERGNQQTIQPLTEALFNEYIAPKVAVKSYRDYQQQFPAATHISLVQKADGGVELGAGGVGPIDKLRPSAAPVEKGWVKAVDSFDSPEAVAHGGSADSGVTNEIDKAAHEAATSHLNDKPQPTDGQKEAGNYAKGHITVHGMDMAIENPKGSTRSGVSPDGTAWSNTMGGHYGYFKGTEGNDGDHVDGYVGPNPESNRVFVIDQVNKDGSFDEHKAMVGYDTPDQAREAYMSSFMPGWTGLGAMTELPVSAFKSWVKDGVKKKPLGDIARQQPAEPVSQPKESPSAQTAEAQQTEPQQQAAAGAEPVNAAEPDQPAAEPAGASPSEVDLTTVEGVARAVQFKVAANRRKFREKSRKEREAKGYAPNSTPESEQADYEAEISGPPSDLQKQSAAAMLGTDPLPLIQMFVHGQFDASEDVFKAITGVKIRGLSDKDKKAALYQWAKWTPEQIAQAEGDAQARKDEAAEKQRQDDLKSAVMDTWLGLDRLKVKEKDGTESTGQEFVLKSVASGFDKAHSQKKGAATVYGLTDGARFISLKAKPFTEFVKAAIAYGGLDKALAYVNPPKPQAPEGFVDRSIATADSHKADVVPVEPVPQSAPAAPTPPTEPEAPAAPAPTDSAPSAKPAPRPKNWDKNYGAASKIAEAMGIALRGPNGKMKKVAELVAEIKSADTPSQPAVTTGDAQDLSKNQPKVDTSAEPVQKPAESGQVTSAQATLNRLLDPNDSPLANNLDSATHDVGIPFLKELLVKAKELKPGRTNELKQQHKRRLEYINAALLAKESGKPGLGVKREYQDEVMAKAETEWARTREVDRMAMMMNLGYSEEIARKTAGRNWVNVGDIFKAKLAKAMAEPLTPVAPTAPTGEDALYTSTAKLTQPYTLDDFIGNVDAGYRAHFDYAGSDGRTLWIERVEGGWVLKSKDDDSTTTITKGGAGIGGRWSKGEALRAAEDDAKFRYTEWKPVVSQQEGMFQTPAEKAAIEGKPIKGTNRKERIDSILSNGGKVVDGTLRTSNGLSMFKLTDVEAAAVPATQKDTSEDIKRRLQEVYPASAAELSPITKARNFLMELEAKLEGQGRVVDDRLVQMIRQQKDVIKELEAEQGKAQDLPSQEASNTIQSSPSEDAITEAKATIESLDAQIKRHEELLGCLG